MKGITKRLTFANVMSSIAVFVALGGAAVAASQLPKNSVGTKQLKKNAVVSSKVKNRSLKAVDFAKNQLPSGPAGPQGPQGPQGNPGPLVSTLPSGATLRGIYSYAGHETTGYSPTFPISFQFPLAAEPNLNLIEIGGEPTAECPGTPENPQAAPGNLCVYEARNDSGDVLSVFPSETGSKLGAVLFANLEDNTDYEFDGSWAVTAP